MKRLVTLLLALCMIFALAACGGGSKTTECEVCGKTAECTKVTYEGESAWLCEDCEALFEIGKEMLGG